MGWSCRGNLIMLGIMFSRMPFLVFPRFSSDQSLSHVQLCSTLGFPVHHQLPQCAQTHAHRVCGATQPSHPLSSPSPSAFNLSQYKGLFQGVSSSYQVTKVLELQPQHQPFQWTFKTDFLEDWLFWSPCSQGTLKNLLQNHSSKASILWCSAFFMVQLSHSYMTTGQTIALTRQIFVSRTMSLLFNMWSS